MTKEITQVSYWIEMKNEKAIPVSHSEASRIEQHINDPLSPPLVRIGDSMKDKFSIKGIVPDKDYDRKFEAPDPRQQKVVEYEDKPDNRNKENKEQDHSNSMKSFLLNYIRGKLFMRGDKVKIFHKIYNWKELEALSLENIEAKLKELSPSKEEYCEIMSMVQRLR